MTLYSKSFLLISLLALTMPIFGASRGEQHNIKIEIALSKDSYFLREPIWLDVTLTNMGDDTIRILPFDPPCQGSGLDILLNDSLGKAVPYTGPWYSFEARSGLIVNPGQGFHDSFNVLDLFHAPPKILSEAMLPYLPIGRYEVRARYGNYDSERLTFQVSNPSEGEIDALQLMLRGFECVVDGQPDSGEAIFRYVAERFPSSVFAEKASQQFLQYEQLLHKFPNSGNSGRYLRGLTWGQSVEERRPKLEKLLAELPPSRARKFVEQMLRYLEQLPRK